MWLLVAIAVLTLAGCGGAATADVGAASSRRTVRHPPDAFDGHGWKLPVTLRAASGSPARPSRSSAGFPLGGGVGDTPRGMSEETVEQVRNAYDTFNRRDWEAFRRLMDRDVTVESRLTQMEGGYRGYDGLRRWWDQVFEAMPDYRVEIENLREVGDIVLVQARGLGHGASSGTPVVDPFWHAIEMKDGRCTWWRNCSTESEALEAIAERSASG